MSTPSPHTKNLFTDIFIRRPVLATVVSLLILLLGLQAVTSLSIRQYPEITETAIQVTTSFPGASPEVVKSFITTPIQQALTGVDGVDYISSSSVQGLSSVTVRLRLGFNPDAAVTDVISKVNETRSLLPREAFDPVVSKGTGNDAALLYVSFLSRELTLSQVTDYLVRVAQPTIQTVPGVGEAEILGGQPFAMRVWLKPDKMAALNVSPSDVDQAIRSNNFTAAPGSLKSDYIRANIEATTDLKSADEFRDLVVSARGDALIRLGDVAEIELGPQSADSSTAFDGEKTVFLAVDVAPGANPLTTITQVLEKLESLKTQAPPGIEIIAAYDATEFIRASIREVLSTIIEAALIVIVVIFLFLGNVRSTIIPVVTIPLSLIGVLFLLTILGYSINLLTLLALVLAIGLVVDDAIVVVENISRHIEEGMRPFDAAITGAREIAMPVIAMTITLAAVYAPIAFVGGLTGQLFREFAFTLAAAVIISGVVALTLSPMMCSRLLTSHEQEGRLSLFLENNLSRLSRWYEARLTGVLNYRRPVLALTALILATSGLLFMTTQNELAPQEDEGFLFMINQAPQWSNVDYLETHTAKVSDFFFDVPEFHHTFIVNGAGAPSFGFAGLILTEWGERDRSDQEVLAELQPKLNSLPGIQVFAFPISTLPGSGGGPPVQMVLQTLGDFRELSQVLDELKAEADKSGLFIFTNTDLRFENPQIDVHIDRAKANELGVSMQDIGTALATVFGGNYVNLFNLDGRSYRVIPQVAREYRATPENITNIYVRAQNGELVPISSFVTLTRSVEPNALTSFQQLNSATIQGVPMPGRSLGEVLEFLESKAAEILPEGFTYDFQGQSRQFKQEGSSLTSAFLFAIVVIFLVLAAQFESFRDPLIILISVPLSICGALIFMNLGLATINIYTQIGLVTLIGLISKHGILMVAFANELQASEGLSRSQAIVKAAAIRLRPILMTTAAMVVGALPLLIASGAGAEARKDVGLVIIAGMSIGTIFTLFVVPVFYSYLARDHRVSEAVIATGTVRS